MAASNHWLSAGWFTLVTTRRQASLTRKLADPAERCRVAEELPARAVAMARKPFSLDTDRDVPRRVRGVFGVDLCTCAIRRVSPGSQT
jgi:hypothetical protein